MDVVGSAAFGVELRTQEAERGMNSEEAERLVWSAQTIFSTGCARGCLPACLPAHPRVLLRVSVRLLRVRLRACCGVGCGDCLRD